MKEYKVTYTYTEYVEAENENEAGDIATDNLIERFASGDISYDDMYLESVEEENK